MTGTPETEAPEPIALYRIYGDADLLLYIGISNDFGRRWKQHARKQPWWAERRWMTTVWFDSRPEAEGAEKAAIKVEHPKRNIVHNQPAPAVRVKKPRRAPREAARPAWIPVRIPGWENPPVHPADQFLPRTRRPGFFTVTEMVMSDVAMAESVIAGFPEKSREAARLKLEYWRAHYKICRIAWQHLQDLYVLEVNLERLGEDRPEVVAAIGKARADCREILEIPCPCCNDKPSPGMTCQDCGAAGSRRPALTRASAA